MSIQPAENQQATALRLALTVFDLQKSAHLSNQNPDLKTRLSNLLCLEKMLLENQDAIVEATCADYGNRSAHETRLAEIFATVDGIKFARKKLRKWMKPQKRANSIWFMGAKNTLMPQPKGVIGVISPWNYPLFLFASPVTSALAAGNHCMIKMAKESSQLAALMARLIPLYFKQETLAIIPDISGSDFTQIPFDHLVFTGSAATARHVMAAAAENLTPVTLELGGKSPCIVDRSFNHALAAKRIINFKTFNAGQTCVAPDYVFVHQDKLEVFLEECKSATQKRYTTIDSKDYTSIISSNALKRLTHYLEDAKQKGAQLHNLMGAQAPVLDTKNRKLSPHALSHITDDALIMQEEIFGPLLPIKTYTNLSEVLDYINARPNPLGLYIFSDSRKFLETVKNNTLSGAVAINDCALQVAQHDMPFGGIGESGMGHYHAFEGFKEFSKLKPIFKQATFASIALLYPPYGKKFNLIFKAMMKL